MYTYSVVCHLHFMSYLNKCPYKKLDVGTDRTAMQYCRTSDAQMCGCTAQTLLTSALDVGEQSVSRSLHFMSREGTPDIHLIGVWVGPRAGLNAVQ
jgi:hypothetical protein